MSNFGPALEIRWRRSEFFGAWWGDGVGCGCGNNMVILVAVEGPGRGLACAFETSTMMWGSVEVRFGCRTSYVLSTLFNLPRV